MVTFGGLTYSNGFVPAGVLAPLADQPDASLRLDAAAAWDRAKADVKARTSIDLVVRGWNRTLAEQEKFFLERYTRQAWGSGPYGDVRWYKGVRYVRHAPSAAAIPGTSNHGWGLAVDVTDYGTVGQFNYARRVQTYPILALHGWTEDEGRGDIQEPWHLVYNPGRDTHPKPPVAPTLNIEENDMILVRDSQKDDDGGYGRVVLVTGGRVIGVNNTTSLRAFQAAGIPLVNVDEEQFDRFLVDKSVVL